MGSVACGLSGRGGLQGFRCPCIRTPGSRTPGMRQRGEPCAGALWCSKYQPALHHKPLMREIVAMEWNEMGIQYQVAGDSQYCWQESFDWKNLLKTSLPPIVLDLLAR